jgi:hypothetical protein
MIQDSVVDQINGNKVISQCARCLQCAIHVIYIHTYIHIQQWIVIQDSVVDQINGKVTSQVPKEVLSSPDYNVPYMLYTYIHTYIHTYIFSNGS